MQLIFLQILKISEQNFNNNQINKSFSLSTNIEDIENNENSNKNLEEINKLLAEYDESINFLILKKLYRESCVYLNFLIELIKDYSSIFNDQIIKRLICKLHDVKKNFLN